MSVDVVNELYVDDPNTDQSRVPVYLNVTLPHLQCDYVGLDIQDDRGRHEVGFVENVNKVPLGDSGCNFEAKFQVNKVPGNFHLSTHSAASQPSNPDMRHIVHSLRFGDDISNTYAHGSFNPLRERLVLEANGQSSHEYVLKVVPSIYEKIGGHVLVSYQYTFGYKEFLSYHHSGQIIPAIWFRYDLLPITVKYKERRQPVYSFLTSVCAIVGGTFTVAGIIDSFLFTASEFYKKFELGKLS